MKMSSLSTFISILLYLAIVSCDDPVTEPPEPKSLCDDPAVYSADRLDNGSVRIYRDYHYWELIGTPEPTGVSGPFKIWWQNFAPITRGTATHTCLAGSENGSHYRYVGVKWSRWKPDGTLMEHNLQWPGFDGTQGKGFYAVYHDANASGIGYPMMVAFSDIKVFYFDTIRYTHEWGVRGPVSGTIGGYFNESFPGDVEAAFSWPAEDKKDKYLIFLFRSGKYCKRSWVPKEGKNCKTPAEWISNKVIFGCEGAGHPPPGSGAPPPTGSGPQESLPPDSEVHPTGGVTESPGGGGEVDVTQPKVDTTKKSSAVGLNPEKYFVSFLITIYFIIRFY